MGRDTRSSHLKIPVTMRASRLSARIARFVVPAGLLDVYSAARQKRRAKRFVEPLFKLPSRSITDIFPGIERASVQLNLAHVPDRPEMVMPLAETLIIGAICQWLKPRRTFEIGTYRGATALAIAMNSPGDVTVFTLDLPPRRKEDGHVDDEIGSAYRGTPAGSRITQLYGDSTTLDFRPYERSMDLVLVDGNHDERFVTADSANALRILKPSGVIVWDDYLWDRKYPECAGVTRSLDKLSEEYDIANIAGTRLAVYRR
jgi:predicted O-methyltransferase YrrM